MNEHEAARWLVEKYGDRISRVMDGRIRRWRLDGKLMTAPEIWTLLAYPFVESGEIQISFPQNQSNMWKVLSRMSAARYEIEEERNAR